MNKCLTCEYFTKEIKLCEADLFSNSYPIKCYFIMIIQELRMLNFPDDEGEEWKEY